MDNGGKTQSQGSAPAIAERRAAGRLAGAFGDRLSTSIDNGGKAIAAAAGIGVFVFAAGYFIEWQRLKQVSLPAEEILPLIPKDQVAAAGVRELFISIVFGGLVLALFGLILAWLIRLAHSDKQSLGVQLLRPIRGREGWFMAGAIGLLTLLFVPLSKGGIVTAVLVTALVFLAATLANDFLEVDGKRRFPLWQLTAAIAIVAIVLATARQWEFPERWPVAAVILTDGSTLHGRYVAGDRDRVLIVAGKNDGVHARIRLLDLPRSEIRTLRLQRRLPEPPEHRSLFAWLMGSAPAAMQLTCIPPECRSGDNARIGPSSVF